MAEYDKKRTIVIGHKNPDTDSICSAICYANLKHQLTGKEFEPARAGKINGETQYVLNYFGVEPPRLVESVKTEVRDIDILETKGVSKDISLKSAWNIMQETGVVTLPAVTDEGVLEGLITVGDITKSYMNVYDASILSEANTRYSNIVETLEGELVTGNEDDYFNQGKVVVAAASPDMMESFIDKGDLVILGNRYEAQLCAIEMEAACIIISGGSEVTMTIKKLAGEKGCTIITTPYDTYTTARLINQSMPISFFMKADNLTTFEDTDKIDDVKEIMASLRYRDFPILDKNGKYIGMISRSNLLVAKGKRLILVDHNEAPQAVEGAESANIKEIIDHHRLASIQTLSPIFFRNQPVGSTATIIYQMYHENDIEIDKVTAGLLCSAIISDTLLFRSPTCTPVDKEAGLDLAGIAGIDPEKYAMDMFAAGSDLRNQSDEEILYQDFKRFAVGRYTFGVGQINSLNGQELEELRVRLQPYLKEAFKVQNMNMMFFMLTNILTESTTLLCEGSGAESMIREAFHVDSPGEEKTPGVVELKGVVSRKKQLVPVISMALQA